MEILATFARLKKIKKLKSMTGKTTHDPCGTGQKHYTLSFWDSQGQLSHLFKNEVICLKMFEHLNPTATKQAVAHFLKINAYRLNFFK